MKFLISGATGFIGSHLVGKLLKDGHETVVLSRNPKKARESLPAGVPAHYWNPLDEEPPKEAFDGVETVIHLAGENVAARRWSQRQKERILTSRVRGTEHLVAKIAGLAQKPKTLINASAIGIYADRGDEELTEESETPEADFLSRVCREWEAASQKIDPVVRAVTIRIGIVLGKDGGALKKMLLPFKLGLGGQLGDGKHWMSWIHVDDLARLIIFCAENKSIKGVVHGTAPQPVRNKEFTKTLGKVLKRPAILPVPGFILKILFGEMATVLLSSAKCLPTKATGMGFSYLFPNLEDALRDLVG